MRAGISQLLNGSRMMRVREWKANAIALAAAPTYLRRRFTANGKKPAALITMGGRLGSPMLCSELERLGYEVHVISARVPGHELRNATRWHRRDVLGSYPELLEVVRSIEPVAVFSEMRNVLLPVKAKLLADLKLPGLGELSHRTSTSKVAFRQALDEGAVTNVPWCRLDRVEETGLQFPFVAKPDRGTGSRGVYFVDSAESLEEARAAVAEFEADVLVGGEMIAEQFIEGRQFDVEGVSHGGLPCPLTITEEHYERTGQLFPSAWYLFSPPIAPELESEILRTASQTVGAAGVENGAWHCEVRVDASGTVYPLDYSNRMGYPKLVGEASGVSYFEQYVRSLADVDFKPPDVARKTVFQRFIDSQEEYEQFVRLVESNPSMLIEFRRQRSVVAGVEKFGRVSLRSDSFGELRSVLDRFDVCPTLWESYYGTGSVDV